MSQKVTFRQQIQRNAVALISLFIAVSGLGYNTWRNERSEFNQNQRTASIEMLLKLGELQQIVFHSHYDMDTSDKGNPRTGWAIVLTIKDLASVLEQPMPAKAQDLVAVWEANWAQLGESQDSADAVLGSIEMMRSGTLELLRKLD